MDKSREIFGNKIANSTYKKALRSKKKFIRTLGDDLNTDYPIGIKTNPILGPAMGVKEILLEKTDETLDTQKGIIVGNIRMGFGHYRISMAIASAANHLGYIPYWFDLHSFQNSLGGRVIAHLNKLYSLGSRLSQKYKLFNKFYWDPLNSEGFRKLNYNAQDQKISELMAPVFKNIPRDMPCVATHVWPAQAALHAGLTNVLNVIPDNWPMALHLAEGSKHTVQTPSSYFGYKTLNGMAKKTLKPIPEGEIFEVGHYIDHEIVSNLEADSQKRMDRLRSEKALRVLLTIGGAGAQRSIFVKIIKNILPRIKKGKAVLFINVGDHEKMWNQLSLDIPELLEITTLHKNDWQDTLNFSHQAIQGDVSGVHCFCNDDIYAAVYSTNLLLRASDILVTKPSELAFYPVPKLMIKRVGGHEAWGAIRAAEIGDGTIECDTQDKIEQMLNLLLHEKGIIKMMVENILKAHKIGTYNGAYRVIELLTGEKK
ncbi:MAG: hypothetical protein PF447_02870 [Spirochaetaceae bacterium]|jgi:UDP-N-acetylglucosamine:LPS N-acetylglucosamine transferase|nr:hypothetical protein [Spirochaetaceae bacterium]